MGVHNTALFALRGLWVGDLVFSGGFRSYGLT